VHEPQKFRSLKNSTVKFPSKTTLFLHLILNLPRDHHFDSNVGDRLARMADQVQSMDAIQFLTLVMRSRHCYNSAS